MWRWVIHLSHNHHSGSFTTYDEAHHRLKEKLHELYYEILEVELSSDSLGQCHS